MNINCLDNLVEKVGSYFQKEYMNGELNMEDRILYVYNLIDQIPIWEITSSLGLDFEKEEDCKKGELVKKKYLMKIDEIMEKYKNNS